MRRRFRSFGCALGDGWCQLVTIDVNWKFEFCVLGRVPGCFGLGALFLCGWEGRTDRLPAGRLHGRAWCGRFAGSY